MVRIKQVNNFKVKVPRLLGNGQKRKPFRAKKLLGDYTYPNLFLCAQTCSGKTVVISNLLQKMADKRTTVIGFIPTHSIDKTWLTIKRDLAKRRIETMFHEHFLDDGINHIDELLYGLQQPEEEDEEVENEQEQPQYTYLKIEPDRDHNPNDTSLVLEEKKQKKKRKVSYKTSVPEYILVFDDLGSDLRHHSIGQLMKKSRHYKIAVILSSQYFKDIHPMAMRQLSHYLLFSSINEEQLKEIYNKVRPPDTTLDQFKELYHIATKKKFHHLTIYVREHEFRINFNRKLLL